MTPLSAARSAVRLSKVRRDAPATAPGIRPKRMRRPLLTIPSPFPENLREMRFPWTHWRNAVATPDAARCRPAELSRQDFILEPHLRVEVMAARPFVWQSDAHRLCAIGEGGVDPRSTRAQSATRPSSAGTSVAAVGCPGGIARANLKICLSLLVKRVGEQRLLPSRIEHPY